MNFKGNTLFQILSSVTFFFSSGTGGELERELRYLELLKLRFGETPLHGCQVMLRDVADSRRINARITEVRQHNEESTVSLSFFNLVNENVCVFCFLLKYRQYDEQKYVGIWTDLFPCTQRKHT